MFHFTLILLIVSDACLFSNKREKKRDLYGWGRRKDLVRVRGGEIAIRIYGLKKYTFAFFKKKKTQLVEYLQGIQSLGFIPSLHKRYGLMYFWIPNRKVEARGSRPHLPS